MSLHPLFYLPHPKLTQLSNTTRPTHKTLHIIHQELNANAISVPSTRGNGTLGHYALVTTDENYLIASGNIPFVKPISPGPQPIYDQEATAEQNTDTYQQYIADKEEYTLYLATEAALKQLVLQAIPKIFIDVLAHDTYGYAFVTTLAILNHLDTMYGTMSYDEIGDNENEMNQSWDLQDPIETLFTRLTNCRNLVASIEPITERTMIRSGLKILTRTNAFTYDICSWRAKAAIDQTMANFITHFSAADIERKYLLTKNKRTRTNF